jgi:hypothetical protein
MLVSYSLLHCVLTSNYTRSSELSFRIFHLSKKKQTIVKKYISVTKTSHIQVPRGVTTMSHISVGLTATSHISVDVTSTTHISVGVTITSHISVGVTTTSHIFVGVTINT